jgi:hypothetical protein
MSLLNAVVGFVGDFLQAKRLEPCSRFNSGYKSTVALFKLAVKHRHFIFVLSVPWICIKSKVKEDESMLSSILLTILDETLYGKAPNDRRAASHSEIAL